MRFRYLGEISPRAVGNAQIIRIRKKDGTVMELHAPTEAGFIPGEDIGVEVNCPRAIRHLMADPRFDNGNASPPAAKKGH